MSGLWCITAALTSCTSDGEVGGAAEAVHDIGVFELEGDADDDPPGGADDWENVLFGTHEAFATTGLITDGPNQSIFTGGGSKDYLDIDQWEHKDGSVPPKDDLEHAFAAAYNVPDGSGGTDFVLYFGADRFTTNGAADLGFWFFQNEVSDDTTDGSFTGLHAVGDILVVAEFTNGGAVAGIKVFEWVGTGGDEGGGTLQTLAGASAAECGTTPGDDACAITNDAAINVSWVSEALGAHSFFEGGVNLTELFGEEQVPCFASFMAETRSSFEVNAVLKDYILSGFQACDISITKVCSGGTFEEGVGFTYDISGDVTNEGGATLFDVKVYETNGTADPSDDTLVQDLGELAAGATESYSGTFTSSVSGPLNTTRVTAAFATGGPVALEETSDPAQCPTVTVTPVVKITKDCTTRLDDSSGQVVVVVDFGGNVCNTDEADNPGEVTLTSVDIFDTKCTADTSDDGPAILTITDDIAPGACETYSLNYTPSSTSSTDPALAEFTDCVRAVASTASFGTATDGDDATCPLCPPTATP